MRNESINMLSSIAIDTNTISQKLQCVRSNGWVWDTVVNIQNCMGIHPTSTGKSGKIWKKSENFSQFFYFFSDFSMELCLLNKTLENGEKCWKSQGNYQSEKVGNMNRTLKRIHSRRVVFFVLNLWQI